MTVYKDGGEKFGLYAFNEKGAKMVRLRLSANRVSCMRGMARHEPITLAFLRTNTSLGLYHNAQWIRKRGA